MKITKRQLKRIIKEERAKLISESNFTDRLERAVISVFEDKLDLPGMDSNPEAAANAIRDRVDEILDQAVMGIRQTMDDDFNPDRPFLESARQPAARHEMEDMANAIEIATDFIRDAAGTDENDFDGLVQYLAHHSWYDENQAADMIDQLIDDGEIQYDSRNDEFYM